MQRPHSTGQSPRGGTRGAPDKMMGFGTSGGHDGSGTGQDFGWVKTAGADGGQIDTGVSRVPIDGQVRFCGERAVA